MIETLPVKNKGKTKKKVHYVDNEKFKNELVSYAAICKESKELGKPDPPIPNYIAECFLKIAENLSRSGNFARYSFRDEMIMDGVENCLQYFRNYDPTKVKRNPDKPGNAFSYFTQIAFFAFVRRINKEAKQTYIKAKLTENFAIFVHPEQMSEGDDFKQFEMYDNISDKIADFETKAEEKKFRRKKKKEEEALPIEND